MKKALLILTTILVLAGIIAGVAYEKKLIPQIQKNNEKAQGIKTP